MNKTDYLVVGAGATGLAFVDTLLRETEAQITIVDKRDVPGGHWNDAYPFVRLHQPSSYYGAASTPLGDGRIDASGMNAGFEELASGPEITAYFHRLMQDRLLPSGRVRFLPMSEHLGGGVLRHVLTGEEMEVAHGRLVDASICENGINLTHQRPYDVEPGVTCVPPNFLPRHAKEHSAFTVVGAGKTAMDSIVWLRLNGAAPDQIRWIVPRDPWMISRAFSQPTGAFYHQSAGGMVHQLRAFAEAGSADDFALRMEAAGLWMRLDPEVMPSIMHGPTVAPAELEMLRSVGDIVRMGHVQHVAADKITLAGGTCAAAPDTLYVDCTARALGHTNTWPIFTPERIGLQMIRLYQPTFSAALLAKIESLDLDDRAKTALAAPVPMTDTVTDWIRSQIVTAMNQTAWSQVPELKAWISQCRLDGFGRPAREVDRNDPEVQAIFGQIKSLMMPAFQGMQRLAAMG